MPRPEANGVPSLDTLFAMLTGPLERLSQQYDRLDLVALFTMTPPPSPRLLHRAGSLAIVDIAGPLSKTGGLPRWISNGTSTLDVADALDEAVDDDSISAIVLRIDSPGGAVRGTADLAGAVRDARKQKKVVAFCEDLCASAAYWVASQCDLVFCNAGCMVGSIGTFAVLIDASRRADAMGMTTHVIRAGAHKGVGVLGAPVSPEQLAELQRQIDSMNSLFLQAVSAGRKLPMDYVRKIADGSVAIGREAERLGLVDGIRTFAEVLNELGGPAPAPTLPLTGMAAAAEYRSRLATARTLAPRTSHDKTIAASVRSANVQLFAEAIKADPTLLNSY